MLSMPFRGDERLHAPRLSELEDWFDIICDRLHPLQGTAPANQDRGQSVVIGAVLVFGVVIISWSMYQGVVVPQENSRAEFDHNQRVQGELLNLRNSVLRTGATGVQQPESITVGTDYHSRTFAINFAVSGGRVTTREPAPNNDNTLYLQNARALDAETSDYLTGNLSFTTKSIVYSPFYTRYNNPPDTVIAGGTGAVFNVFADANLSIGDQLLINERTITIVTIDGHLTKAKSGEGATVTVETEPLSVASRSVTITNQGSDRINITIPTRIDNEKAWNESTFESEFGDNGAVFEIKRPSQNYISILLDKQQYTLRMMQVGVGQGTTAPDARYLTDVETPASVIEETSTKLTLEVRDKYNNPVDGFQVNGSIETSAGGTGTEKLSVVGESDNASDGRVTANTSNGQVIFNYTAPDVTENSKVRLNFSIYDNDTPADRVWGNFTVSDNDGGGSGGGGSGDGSTAPQIDSLSLNENNKGGDPHADFDASWSVSDSDGDLDTVELTLTDLDDGYTESKTVDVSGSDASGTTTFQHKFEENSGDEYEVELVVTDSNGNTASATATEIEDGS